MLPATGRNVVGVLGNIFVLCLFLSPVPTFVRICKKGSIEQFSPVPYLVTVANCLVWFLYGLPVVHPHSTLVITINAAGFAIEAAYLVVFLIYCRERRQRLKVVTVLAGELVLVAVLAALVLTLLHDTARRTFAVGIVGVLVNVSMYASPLSIMKLVIKTKSVEYMPFLLSLASFANGMTWATYALLPFDPFICVPNAVGSLLGLVQLILYGAYYKSTKEILAGRAAHAEVSLSAADFPRKATDGH